MSTWEEDILFYENGRGGVAVSVNRGRTLLLANGREIPVANTIWEETNEDIEGQLNDVQRAAVEAHRSQPDPDVLGQIVHGFKRKREHIARTHLAQPEKPIRRIRETAQVVVSDFED